MRWFQLSKQMPPAWVNWMVETGETIDAQKALDVFLINEIVSEGAGLGRARAIAQRAAGERLAREPPSSKIPLATTAIVVS